MILRLIRGRADQAKLDSLRAALSAKLDGTTALAPGLTRYHLSARPDGDALDVLVLSFWRSAEEAVEGDSQAFSPLAIATDAGLDGLDAAHFEVDQSILREGGARPIAIRVAAGRFSKPGADIEMLNLLRERVPGIDDAMTEAYVGRRITDRGIEVAFVSTWQRPPTHGPIDQTFWPDITLRYDEFSVSVFTPTVVLEPIG